MRILAVLLVAIAAPVGAQTCSQQPGAVLKGVVEWGCRGMDYDQAWDLLSRNGIAPVRPAKVTQLGQDLNRKSRKQAWLIGLRIAGLFTPAIPLVGDINEWWAQALFIGGPKLLEEGTTFFTGQPDDFRETPSEAGFVAIYSAASNQQIVSGALPPILAPKPAKLEFRPSTWYALYGDTAARRSQVTETWRGIDESWRIEEAIADAQARMNFAEVELLAQAHAQNQSHP
jgi:hypothetical protein